DVVAPLAQYRRLARGAGPGGRAAGTHRVVPAAGEGAGRTASSPGDLRGLERSQRRGARHPPGPDDNRRHVMVAEPPRLWDSRVIVSLEERLLAPNLLTQTLSNLSLLNGGRLCYTLLLVPESPLPSSPAAVG